jgi:transposase-like protein
MDSTSDPGISPEETQRLKDALGRWLVGESELRAVVLDAVDAGGSVAEVAAITGLREETIEQWTGLTGDGTARKGRSGSRTANADQVVNADGEVDQLAERRSIRGGGWQAVEAAQAKSRRKDPDPDVP